MDDDAKALLRSIDASMKTLVQIAQTKRSRGNRKGPQRVYYTSPDDPCFKCPRKDECKTKKCYERDQWMAAKENT